MAGASGGMPRGPSRRRYNRVGRRRGRSGCAVAFFSLGIGALTVVALTMLLTACAGAVPWNVQMYAGINYIEFKRCADEQRICYLKVISGKEGPLTVTYQRADGTMVTLTSDYKAFEAQQFRAELEQAITEEFGDMAPAIASAVTSAVIKGVVPIP